MIEIRRYQSEYFTGVDALWKDAFPNDNPWNAAAVAIPEKMRVQPDLMLVALQGDQIVGSVMAGYDGHRGWISRIAVLTSHRARGVGQALIAAAEERLGALGCVKINLQVVAANAGFEQNLSQFMPSWMAFDMRLMSERFLTEGMRQEVGDVARLTALLGRPLRSYRDFATEIASSQ